MSKKLIFFSCLGVSFLILVIPLLLIQRANTVKSGVIEVPVNWDSNYIEDDKSYMSYNYNTIDWNTYVPDSSEEFTTVYLTDVDAGAEMVYEYMADGIPETKTVLSNTDAEIAMLSENEAWTFVTNGIWNSYPTGSYSSNASKLQELKSTNTKTITVKCWYWNNPKDAYDLSKTTVTKTFAVNTKLADTFEHIFEDIYNHPSQPIINIADGGMGTWVLRGKNHNSNNTMSAHSLGVAIDINPSTGSFYVNNTWYGNAYGQKTMPESIWLQLPNVQKKYHVLYDGCPIVEIFKSYGFYWGGDWKTGTDAMHLSFLGDGKTAREKGINNYLERR